MGQSGLELRPQGFGDNAGRVNSGGERVNGGGAERVTGGVMETNADDDDDETKLLGSEAETTTTESLFISNPISTTRFHGLASVGRAADSTNREVEAEENFGGSVEEGGGEAVAMLATTTKTTRKRSKYLSGSVTAAAKNLMLDLRLFFW